MAAISESFLRSASGDAARQVSLGPRSRKFGCGMDTCGTCVLVGVSSGELSALGVYLFSGRLL